MRKCPGTREDKNKRLRRPEGGDLRRLQFGDTGLVGVGKQGVDSKGTQEMELLGLGDRGYVSYLLLCKILP